MVAKLVLFPDTAKYLSDFLKRKSRLWQETESGGTARVGDAVEIMYNLYCRLSSIDDFSTPFDMVNKSRVVKSAEKRHIAEIWQ